jgi:hypothetical protein
MAKIMPTISREFIEDRIPSFAPYVFIVTTLRMPTSIAMAAVCGGSMKRILLPKEYTGGSLPLVQEIARKHFVKNEGRCALFGEIKAFLYVFSPTQGFLLDTGGNLLEVKSGSFWPESICTQDGLLDQQ